MRDFKESTYEGKDCVCCSTKTHNDPIKKERERVIAIINERTGHRVKPHTSGTDCPTCELIAEINEYVPVYYYCKCGSRSTTNFQDPDYSPDTYCPKCANRMEKRAVNE